MPPQLSPRSSQPFPSPSSPSSPSSGITSPPTRLSFGYGTNGLADLRLDDALALLADLGYDGVGLTLDHMHLDPLAADLAARTRRLARRLDALGLTVTVETGARYVLDPRRKHGPTLLDPDPDDRARRADLLIRAVQVAADLGAHAVHCFSGVTPPGTEEDTAWKRLPDALAPVLDAANAADIPLAVEPEPGHLLATLADFHRLRAALDSPAALGLTLDIGHCQCLEPLPPADCVRAAAPWLRHVQIEDMRRGVHEHLPLGDGEIDFPPVLEALAAVGYQALTVVELPRHSHAGPHFAEQSLSFLHRTTSRPSLPRSDRTTGHTADRTSTTPDGSRPLSAVPERERLVIHPRTPAPPTTHPALVTPSDLRGHLNAHLADTPRAWLAQALDEAADHPGTHGPISVWELRLAEAGRRCGTDYADAVRVLILHAARAGTDALTRVYRQGTADERRAVLHALPHLVPGPDALHLVEDALRTNDTRLVAAALGPYAARHLAPHPWRHAVLKCLFTGVPVDEIADLARRAHGDTELARMLGDYADERTAAGRPVPEDLYRVLALTAPPPADETGLDGKET